MIPVALVLGFGAGIVWADGGHALPFAPWLATLAFAGTLCSSGTLLLLVDPRRSGSTNRPPRDLVFVQGIASLSALALVFVAGYERLDRELAQAQRDLERAEAIDPGATRLAEARVRARRSGASRERVELDDVRAVDGGSLLPASLTLWLDDASEASDASDASKGGDAAPSRADRLLWPGARVRVGLRVSPMRAPRNPGSTDIERVAARRGRAARARLVKPDWVLELTRDEWTISEWASALARRAARERHRLADRFAGSGAGGALVRALALGDRSAIPEALNRDFQRLGLAHLLAVSGLHVGFVAGLTGWLVMWVCGWLGLGRGRILPFDSALGVACVAAAAYAVLTGAGVSVERASLVFGLFALSRFARRVVPPWAALGSVALVVLWGDPGALFDRGAQLSFGACAALIAGGFWRAPGVRDAERDAERDAGLGAEPTLRVRIWNAIRETFRASLVVSLGTAPLLAWHDLPLAIASPVLNVVAIPWTGFVVLPASLAAVASVDHLPAALTAALVLPAEALARGVQVVADRLVEPPHWALLSPLWLALLGGLGLCCSRLGKARWAVLAWIAIALTSASPLASDASGPFDREPPRIVFFDVGQGDAALVQGRGASLLIDSGPGPPDGSGGGALVRGLHALGVARLDVFAVTHGDLDHRGGAIRILGSLPVDELWLPATGREDAALQALAACAQARGTRVRWLGTGAKDTDRRDLGIAVLWPDPAQSVVSRNETSLVLRVRCGAIVGLFTADIGESTERMLLAQGRSLTADILKVAHHGSRGSSSPAFLEAVSPSTVIVSAPCDPTRGLPNGGVLDRLRDLGASMGWTGRDGAVSFARDAGTGRWTLRTWGRARRCRA